MSKLFWHFFRWNLVLCASGLVSGSIPACFASEIAVVTLAVGEAYKRAVNDSIQNKQRYCEKWGYDFYCFDESLDPLRHPAWSKILAVETVLKEHPEYRWVFWVDVDSLILNFAVPLEFFVDEGYNFIVGGDCDNFAAWKTNVNTGVFFIKNCSWSLDFLKTIYSHTEFASHYWEQQSIYHSAHSEQDAIYYELNFHEQKWMRQCKVVPFRLFNAWRGDYARDFLIHFAGANTLTFLRLSFQKWKDRIIHEEPTLDYFLDCYGCNVKKESSPSLPSIECNEKDSQIAWIGWGDGREAEKILSACRNLDLAVYFDEPISFHTGISSVSYQHVVAAFFSQKYKNRFQCIEGNALETIRDYAQSYDRRFDLIFVDKNASYEATLERIALGKMLAHQNTRLFVRGHALAWGAIATCRDRGIIEIVTDPLPPPNIEETPWIEARYIF